MILFDAKLFRDINDAAGRGGWLDALGVFCAEYLIFIIAALVLIDLLWAYRRGRVSWLKAVWTRLSDLIKRRSARPPEAPIVRALIAAAFAYAANFFFSLIWFRPRPFAALLHVHQLIAKSPLDKSFPSDHATLSFVVAFSMMTVRPLFGLGLAVLAAAVAWGRVFVGVHYPLDVFAGALAGLVWSLVAARLDRGFRLTAALVRGLAAWRRRL